MDRSTKILCSSLLTLCPLLLIAGEKPALGIYEKIIITIVAIPIFIFLSKAERYIKMFPQAFPRLYLAIELMTELLVLIWCVFYVIMLLLDPVAYNDPFGKLLIIVHILVGIFVFILICVNLTKY